jgi:hypothetical protein
MSSVNVLAAFTVLVCIVHATVDNNSHNDVLSKSDVAYKVEKTVHVKQEPNVVQIQNDTRRKCNEEHVTRCGTALESLMFRDGTDQTGKYNMPYRSYIPSYKLRNVCRLYTEKYRRCADITGIEKECVLNKQVEFYKTTLEYLCGDGKDRYLENVKCLERVDYKELISSSCLGPKSVAKSSASNIKSIVANERGRKWRMSLTQEQTNTVYRSLCKRLKYQQCLASELGYECGGGAVEWMEQLAEHQLMASFEGRISGWAPQKC